LASTPASRRAGELPLDQIVRRYPLSEINTAFADAERGNVVKPVITFGE
jgi:aryl-alcohol dehydrogenase